MIEGVVSTAGPRANHAMRRRPQQDRARSTIGFIKQAALDLIEHKGVHACRTEAVAARAGVSIGTLYKYYPNRESILHALYEDASIAYAQLVGTLTLQILDLPTEQGMSITLRNVVRLHRSNHLVLLRIAEEMPELRLQEQPLSFHNLVRSNIRAYLQHRNPRLATHELQRRVFFIERTVFSCIEGYLRTPDPTMSLSRFIKDLAMLISDIVDRPPQSATKAEPRATKRRTVSP